MDILSDLFRFREAGEPIALQDLLVGFSFLVGPLTSEADL